MKLRFLSATWALLAFLVVASMVVFVAPTGAFLFSEISNSSAGSLSAKGGLSRFLKDRVLDSSRNVPGSKLEANWPNLLEPTHLRVSGRARGFVGLVWDDVPAATSYEVLLQHTGAEETQWKKLPFEDTEVTFRGSSAIVSGLADNPDLVHNFAVRALNDLGISDLSELVKAPSILEAPTNLTGNFQGSSSAALNWHVVPNADSYQVGLLQSINSVPQWVILPFQEIGVSIEGSQAVVDALPEQSHSEYHFAVRATNDLGESDWSEVLLIQFDGLAFTAAINTSLNNLISVVLDWQEVPNASSYMVRYWQQNQWVTLPFGSIQISFDGTSAVISQFPPYVDYNFQVRAVDEAGNFASEWFETIGVFNDVNTPVITEANTPIVPVQAANIVLPTATPVPTQDSTPSPTPSPNSTQIALQATPTPGQSSATGSSSRESSSNRNSSPTATPTAIPTATPIPEAPPTILAVEWQERGEKIRVSWNSVPGADSYNVGHRCPDNSAWSWLAYSGVVQTSRGTLTYREEGVLEHFLGGLGNLVRSPETCDGGRGLEFSVTSVFDGIEKLYNASEWVGLSELDQQDPPVDPDPPDPQLESPQNPFSTWVPERDLEDGTEAIPGHWIVLWIQSGLTPDKYEFEFFCKIGSDDPIRAETDETVVDPPVMPETNTTVWNLDECSGGRLYYQINAIKDGEETGWVVSADMIKPI